MYTIPAEAINLIAINVTKRIAQAMREELNQPGIDLNEYLANVITNLERQ